MSKQSKFIALVLRHKPEQIGLTLDSSGWADVSDLLTGMKRHGEDITEEMLAEIVSTDEKQRYQFSTDRKRIRASQGHSVAVDLGYQSEQPPDVLFHGTASRFVESIKKTGLEKRARHHVHLSVSQEVAISVGNRYGQPVILRIDARTMKHDGHSFYRSDNDVWLTENVPVQYITFPTD